MSNNSVVFDSTYGKYNACKGDLVEFWTFNNINWHTLLDTLQDIHETLLLLQNASVLETVIVPLTTRGEI